MCVVSMDVEYVMHMDHPKKWQNIVFVTLESLTDLNTNNLICNNKYDNFRPDSVQVILYDNFTYNNFKLVTSTRSRSPLLWPQEALLAAPAEGECVWLMTVCPESIHA